MLHYFVNYNPNLGNHYLWRRLMIRVFFRFSFFGHEETRQLKGFVLIASKSPRALGRSIRDCNEGKYERKKEHTVIIWLENADCLIRLQKTWHRIWLLLGLYNKIINSMLLCTDNYYFEFYHKLLCLLSNVIVFY